MDNPSSPDAPKPAPAPALPRLLGLLLPGLLLFAGYRVVAITLADRFVQASPETALAVLPSHPDALLALAERQLAAGRTGEAAATARELLARAPLAAGGFRVLAEVASRDGDPELAQRLM